VGIADEATRDALAKEDEAIMGRKRFTEDEENGGAIRQGVRSRVCVCPASTPYDSLAQVLDAALLQASSGKGAERHANNQPFENQPIMQITRLLDGHPVGALAYQAIKKIIEAGRLYTLHGPAAAVKETMGAINYAAAMAIRLREMGEAKK